MSGSRAASSPTSTPRVVSGFSASVCQLRPESRGSLRIRSADPAVPPESPGGLDAERIADVPIYWTDALVRRAASLQKTADARAPRATANAATLKRFGLAPGDRARVRQGAAVALLECGLDPRLPDGVVRVPAGHPSTGALGPMFGSIRLERAG